MRQISGQTLVVATHNTGKVLEIGALLAPFGITAVTASSLNLDEPEETEPDFIGNAILKAKAAALASGFLALADDSGLVVTALEGAPGIFSARWAGPAKDFRIAMRRIEDELCEKNAHDRSAHFVCALALYWPDGEVAAFEGRLGGTLTWPPRGKYGFGYDPIFVPRGFEQTFGEMDPVAKHAMSHRALAFEKLVAACLS